MVFLFIIILTLLNIWSLVFSVFETHKVLLSARFNNVINMIINNFKCKLILPRFTFVSTFSQKPF